MSSPTRVVLHEIGQPNSELLERVLRWLLSLTTTQEAVAELIDDMPIRDHYFGRKNIIHRPHPDIEHRLKPNDEAVELASKLCQMLDPQTLPVDAQTAENFQHEMQVSSTSYRSALRLLEIISVIIHDFASNLYHHFHPPPEFSTPQMFQRIEHQSYLYSAVYRNREMSKAGYWAETVVFGGPMLFAKGSNGDECNAAFVHLSTGEICELTEAQVKSFADWTIATGKNIKDEKILPEPVLPFQVGEDARRLSKEQAVEQHIYRDLGQISLELEDKANFVPTRGGRPDGTRGCVE